MTAPQGPKGRAVSIHDKFNPAGETRRTWSLRLPGWAPLTDVLLLAGWLLLRALVPVLLFSESVILHEMVLNPLVVYLEGRRVPRPAGVALVLLMALAAIVVLVVAVAVPAFTEQLQLLIQRAPSTWQSIRGHIADFSKRYPHIAKHLAAGRTKLHHRREPGWHDGERTSLRSTIGVVGGLFIFVFAVLLLIFAANPRPLIVGYLAVIPDRHREKARRTLIRMMEQMTAWARGVAINGVITGASTGILLSAVELHQAFGFARAPHFSANSCQHWAGAGCFARAIRRSQHQRDRVLARARRNFIRATGRGKLPCPLHPWKRNTVKPVIILTFRVAMGWLFGLAGESWLCPRLL